MILYVIPVQLLNMEKNCRRELQQLIKLAEKIYKSFYHIIFLETCKSFNLVPKGLRIKKQPCIGNRSNSFTSIWENELNRTEENLRDILLYENVKILFSHERRFWKDIENTEISERWLLKLRRYLVRMEENLLKKKCKKVKTFSVFLSINKTYVNRIYEHLPHFDFKYKLEAFCNSYVSDFENLFTILNLCDESTLEKEVPLKDPEINNSSDETEKEEDISFEYVHDVSNRASLKEGRLQGNFVSQNVINLSKKDLTKSEVSLLSKGLKFVPTPSNVDISKIRQELEIFGRNLRLKWHFRDSNNTFDKNIFKKKSKFNPKGKDPAIELYLNSLEERLINMSGLRNSYNNLSNNERMALNDLKKDFSIIIKEADKGSGVVVWDRGDFIAEAESQLNDIDVYEEVNGDTNELITTIKEALYKIKKRGDITVEVLGFFCRKSKIGTLLFAA